MCQCHSAKIRPPGAMTSSAYLRFSIRRFDVKRTQAHMLLDYYAASFYTEISLGTQVLSTGQYDFSVFCQAQGMRCWNQVSLARD